MVVLWVFTMDYRHHTSLVVQSGDRFGVEVHGPARLEIVVAVLNNYPMKLHISNAFGPVVLVDAGQDEERLFKAIEALQALKAPLRRDEEFHALIKNPSLAGLEGFVAVKRLLEGRNK